MKTYLEWLKETTEQAGPDIDSIMVMESGQVVIKVSIISARSFQIAREFSDAGHRVSLLSGDAVEHDFNREHYGLSAREAAHATQGGCGHTCDDDCRKRGCSYDGAPDGVF